MATREYPRGTLVMIEYGNNPKIDGKVATVIENSASWEQDVEIVVDGYPGHVFSIPVSDVRALS